MIISLILKNSTKCRRKPKLKLIKLSFLKCSNKQSSLTLIPKCTKSPMISLLIQDGGFSKKSIKRILSKIILMNFGTNKNNSKNKTNKETWTI